MIQTSINTVRPKHHVWSIACAKSGLVIREGVATSLTAAMREIRKAKKSNK